MDEEIKIVSIRARFAEKLELYVKTMLNSEYAKYIPEIKKKRLLEIKDFKNHVFIEETGTISLFVMGGDEIYFPKSAFKILKAMKMLPGYGINKKHKTFQENTLINNDNTFADYIMHAFISGEDPEDYYQENLLHETMHFCGSGGASALREGMTEWLTRKVASKYNFKTSGCGYPKEVKIVLELIDIFDEETILKIAFSRDKYTIPNVLGDRYGEDAIHFYYEIEDLMENEFDEKYYRYRFPGIMGPIKKTLKYNEIDYTKVCEKIEEYKERQKSQKR